MIKINSEVIDYLKNFKTLHIKRWDELPSFEIYANQIVDIVKQELFFLDVFGDEFITKSMINNYVKQKVIPKPINKKYGTEALAKLIAITLLKQILEISDIDKGIVLQTKILGNKKAYDTFIGEFERAAAHIYGNVLESKFPLNLNIESIDASSINLSLSSVAIANKILIKKLLNSNGFLVQKDER